MSNLGGFTPVIDETTGRITGYKTEVGADTVFPFSSGKNVAFIEVQATTFNSGWTKVYWYNKETNEIGTNTVYMEKTPTSVTLFGKIEISYNSFKALTSDVKYIKGLSGFSWSALSKNTSTSVSLSGTGSSQFITFICD